MHNKHLIFNRSVLWTVFLFSIALFVPWALSESLPNLSGSKISSSTPSPQTKTSPQPSPNQVLTKQQGYPNVASNSVSGQSSADSAATTTSSNSGDSNTETKTPQSTATKPETKTKQSNKSTDPQTHTSQVSKPADKTQTSESSKPNKQQLSQSQSYHKSKAKAAQRPHATPVIEMRVAIANGESSLVVATSTPGQVLNARGKVLGTLSANKATSILPNGSNIRVGNWETKAGVWVKPTKAGLIFVGVNGGNPKEYRWYRGDLLLVSQGDKLLAVNYVDLESYIASVVGSEMPASWPMDALKAQSIAARSYALVHYLRPANSLYHLGNTQRWQVYGGINSEWNTTRQAAEETRGIFLSYKGGVVESMYAATDKIVSDVHGGSGMSQNGALTMAEQGYNYQQILSRYYPGTSFAWIDAQASTTD